MKTNERKWIVVAMILLAMIIGSVLLRDASAKKEEVEESISTRVKTKEVVVWLTEHNGLDWEDALTEIEEILYEEYDELELMEMHYDLSIEDWVCNSVKFIYEDPDGDTVSGLIVNKK